MRRKRWIGLTLMAWDTAWKAAAIHRAWKNGQRRWILPLAVVNSMGLLPMLYLFRWSKPRPTSS